MESTNLNQSIEPFAELFNLFHKASRTLKYPKIRFRTDDGSKVQLYLATKGYIAIKVDSVYQGKITPEPKQTFYWYLTSRPDYRSEVMDFACHPITNAVIKGQRYSNCCFCGLELTNKASLQMGYGPICADKYGLPWHYTGESENQLVNLENL